MQSGVSSDLNLDKDSEIARLKCICSDLKKERETLLEEVGEFSLGVNAIINYSHYCQ